MNIAYIWNRVLKKIRGTAIGGNSKIDHSSKIQSGTTFVDSTMKRNSYCGYDCKIINCDIGAFCSIADGVVIGLAQHPIEWVSTSPVFYRERSSIKKKYSLHELPRAKRVQIGNDVWIGERAMIKSGVSIGDGAVIGMGSIVTHDVEPYSIVGGVPAKLIRKRFDDNTCKQLLQIKWWERDDKCLESIAEVISDPTKVIERLK